MKRGRTPKDSQYLFETLANKSLTGIYLIQNGKFIYVNPKFEEITGYDSTELIGGDTLSYVFADDRDFVRTSAIHMLKNGNLGEMYSYEFRIQRKTGETRWVLETVSPILFQGRKTTLGNIVDITERKKAEESLTASEARFRALIENAPVGISMSTPDGRILDVNRTLVDMYGYDSEEDMRSHSVRDLFRNPDDRNRLLRFIGEGHRGKAIEIEAKRKDGSVFWVSLSAISQNSIGGQQYIVITTDITEKREMQIALHKAKAAAEAATEAKSEFLAHMSHEIRTPMNAIIGLSHLAAKGSLPPKQQDYLVKIQSSANTLMRIINDILDISKIEAGKLEIETIPFKLSQMLNNIANIFFQRAEEKGLKIRFETDGNVPQDLRGDPLRIGQILTNLIGNSLKFTQTGEIVVSTSLDSKDAENAILRFSVRDTGIGMTEEQRQKLFQPFAQADSSITRKHGGTGLGLIISKQLLERMGGHIGVESLPGKGSTFTFTIAAGLQTEIPLAAKRDLLHKRRLKVLVADDNSHDREVMLQMLRDLSCDVTAVESGRAVLQALEQEDNALDLVVLDWRMPDLDGFETARRIRNNMRVPRPPKIFMITAFGREEAMLQARQMGLDAFLVKPVNSSMLFDALAEAFGREETQEGTMEPRRTEAGKTLAGAHLLVVEDNEINQQVARELLENFGATVEIAANGQLAVDRIDQGGARFHAVLMDLQMPVMDGFAATIRIRANTGKETLPILAMTAHALQSERQRCLQAGMNGVVTKPIEPDALRDELIKWIQPKPAGATAPSIGAGTLRPEAREADAEDDIPGIDMKAAMVRLMGNRALLKKVVNDFVSSHSNDPVRIRRLLDRGDVVSASRAVHTLKGVAGNLSAGTIFSIAERLDILLQQPRSAAIAEELDRLENAFRVIAEGLSPQAAQANTAPHPAPAVSPGDSEMVEDMILELLSLLQKNSMRARGKWAALKETIDTAKLGEPIGRFEEHMSCFDFRMARRVLEEIAAKVRAGLQ